MSSVRPAGPRAVGYLLWLFACIALMVAIGAALAYARRQVIAQLDTPEARAQWQAWKAETEKQSQSPGPVARRKVHSDEPPALVLLRDHFTTIMAMSFTVASCFFVFLMMVVRGTRKTP